MAYCETINNLSFFFIVNSTNNCIVLIWPTFHLEINSILLWSRLSCALANEVTNMTMATFCPFLRVSISTRTIWIDAVSLYRSTLERFAPCVTCGLFSFLYVAPPQPKNLAVQSTLFGNHTYQFNVTWSPPELQPAYYTIVVSDNSNNSYTFNVSGSSSHSLLGLLWLPAGVPIVGLYAHSNGGYSRAVKIINKSNVPSPKEGMSFTRLVR